MQSFLGQIKGDCAYFGDPTSWQAVQARRRLNSLSPCQSIQVVRTGPHTPTSACRTEANHRPVHRGGLQAGCGLALAIVDHPPALADLGDEGVGVGVAGLGGIRSTFSYGRPA